MPNRRLLIATLALGMTHAAWAQSFTYQGSLYDEAGPADGLHNLSFKLFDNETAGNQIGGTIAQNGMDVVEGLFTSELDFGATAFNGADRWLEISVNGTTLSPRTLVSPAPMSIFSMRPWVTSGSSVYYDGGSVGINTATPAATLDVNGTARMGGIQLPTGAAAGRYLASDAGGNGTWTAFPASLPPSGAAGGDLAGTYPNPTLAVSASSLGKVSGGSLFSDGTNVALANSLFFGAGGSFSGDQGGSIILGNSSGNGNVPYIDFHYGVGAPSGFNARLINDADGQLSLIANRFNVSGDVSLGASREIRFTDNGQIRSLDNSHRILFRRAENKMELREYGDLVFSPGATAGDETAKVVMQANGNTGIGTTTPRRRLEVNGDIQMSGGRTKLFYKGDFNDGTHTGSMAFYTPDGGETAIMTPHDGDGNHLPSSMLSLGGFGAFDSSSVSLSVSGNVGIGTPTPTAKLDVNGTANFSGEITARVVTITGGSDVAEPYEVAAAGDVQPQPGMVVAIDPHQIGQMRVACRAYDTTVAGILSGANGISPGITLRQKGTVADGALPVASIGRVWCWCDANAGGPIEAGDMLTTCDVPGHAMKVTDFGRANGSVIGKAMSPLKSGRGLVLVLVSLK